MSAVRGSTEIMPGLRRKWTPFTVSVLSIGLGVCGCMGGGMSAHVPSQEAHHYCVFARELTLVPWPLDATGLVGSYELGGRGGHRADTDSFLSDSMAPGVPDLFGIAVRGTRGGSVALGGFLKAEEGGLGRHLQLTETVALCAVT